METNEGLTNTSKSGVLENPILTDFKSMDVGKQVNFLVPGERMRSIGGTRVYF